ncbi:hypothetical protein [Chromohalobacter israelensis]|uniref:hypothetical protein n=1 Tax=Chromohalobacter israelensis TaxID=141390 RepID=UPI0009FC035A|nr:hypothetical protein [Chromohalobacter israelensis]
MINQLDTSSQTHDLVLQRLVRQAKQGMIHYGVIFFLLEKLGAVIGTSNLHIYAAMRGESLEEFQKTRNQQVTYSVARRRDTDEASSADT